MAIMPFGDDIGLHDSIRGLKLVRKVRYIVTRWLLNIVVVGDNSSYVSPPKPVFWFSLVRTTSSLSETALLRLDTALVVIMSVPFG